MKAVMGLWILSLATAVGTGWLVFSRSHSGPELHAVFLLSVGGFVACSIWALARGLSPLGEHIDASESPKSESKVEFDDHRP